MEADCKINEKLQGLLRLYTKGNVILAFSGGVDSSLLLHLLCEEVRVSQTIVYAVTIHTKLHPVYELKIAARVAEEVGAVHKIITIDELEEADILNNPPDRCYRCKKYLFTRLTKMAKDLGVETIIEGTNEDDLHVYRPGIQAVRELGIESPLAQLHITKAEVRQMAAALGIPVADRPSTPCLATRFPYDTPLSYESLRKVEQGEAYLRNLGFYNVRLRVHGAVARVEIDAAEMRKLLETKDTVAAYLKGLGYDYVTLDLEGFRSGSMDIGLKEELLMKKETLKIENIPAIIWGEKSSSVYIYVHGKLSSKEEAQDFAKKAIQKGYQVISFDLPEHGERKNEEYPCMVWNGVHDLEIIGKHVRKNWKDIYLCGSSLGAYFSLLAYKDLPLIKSFFVSPILDMERLIQNMMEWCNVDEQTLREKQGIQTPIGETLYWDYYCFVKENPIVKWNVPTEILYGSEDNLTEREVVENFSNRFNCNLTVLENSEHWFHTERQLTSLDKWLDKHIQTVGTQPLEEMSAFFNSRAERYNTVHLENIDGGIESKQIIASFLPDHTKTMIDFGIGTGLELEGIFKRFPDIEVTGLDISENMLQRLKKNYPDKSINLRCVSYLDYDFGTLRYDAALSVMTLHHYDHKTKTDLYRNIYSCMKHNGIYIECDYMLSEKDYENAQDMEDFYFSEYKHLKEEQGITDNRGYHYDTPCTVANQIKMLSEAGFANIKEVWHKGNTIILIANKL